MSSRARLVLASVAAMLAVAACGESASPGGSSPGSTSPGSTTPGDTTPGDTTGGRERTPTELAVADLQQRLGTTDDPTVVLSEEVTWRDGSLGCPEPGRSYTQALEPGYRIVLALDGREYAYHGARDADPFYCEHPSDPLPPGGGLD